MFNPTPTPAAAPTTTASSAASSTSTGSTGSSKLQDVLHSILLLGATLGPEFIHSAKATNALGLALAGLEAVIEVVAAKA